MKTENEGVCPQRIAEALGGFTVDDLVAINCTIATMIDRRLVNLRKEARKGATAAVAGLTRTADLELPPVQMGKGKEFKRDIELSFAHLDPTQIDMAAAALQRLAAMKRKENKAA